MKYKRKDYLSKEEWLNARKIGGSSAGAIMGVSKWLTANEVYSDIVFNRRQDKTNARTIEGTIAEDFIRKLFKLEHPEYDVEEPPLNSYWLFISKDNDYLTLTPDALLTEKATGRKGGLEIKDVEIHKKVDYDNWVNGMIPPYYFTQLIHYFIVKDDIEFMVLQVRFKLKDMVEERSYLLERNSVKKEIEKQYMKMVDFIENNIKKKVRPQVQIIL